MNLKTLFAGLNIFLLASCGTRFFSLQNSSSHIDDVGDEGKTTDHFCLVSIGGGD